MSRKREERERGVEAKMQFFVEEGLKQKWKKNSLIFGWKIGQQE